MSTDTAAPATPSAAPSAPAPAPSPASSDTLPMRERVRLAAEGPPTSDATAAPAAKVAAPEDLKAKRFAAAAKLERETQTRKAALEEQAAKYAAWEKEQAELRDLQAADPLAYLERLGVKYEDLTTRILDRKEPTEADKALAEERQAREVLAKQVEDLKREREEERAAISKQREDDFLREGKAALEAQRAEFSLLLAEPEADALIMEYLEGVARKTGQVLPYLEACKHIQGGLEEKYSAVLQTEWARGKLPPVSSERAAPAKSDPGQHPPRTLTNAHASEGRTYTPDELLSMPMRQRMAIAAAGPGKR